MNNCYLAEELGGGTSQTEKIFTEIMYKHHPAMSHSREQDMVFGHHCSILSRAPRGNFPYSDGISPIVMVFPL